MLATILAMRMIFRFLRFHLVMFVRYLVMPVVSVIALEKEQCVAVKEIARVVSEERLWIEHH